MNVHNGPVCFLQTLLSSEQVLAAANGLIFGGGKRLGRTERQGRNQIQPTARGPNGPLPLVAGTLAKA